MGKKEDRQLIGLRMRASEIKRRRHELDERYGRIDRICPICGKLIRKPKRGPTARFCSRSCRQTYAQRKQDAIDFKKNKSAELALDQLTKQGGDYRKRADGKRESTLNAHKEIKSVRKSQSVLMHVPTENHPGMQAGTHRTGDGERIRREPHARYRPARHAG